MKTIYNFDKISKLSDQEIVQAILNRDKEISFLYLYKKCYPIFDSVHKKYYTDCENPTELISEIYVYILTPNKNTGKCKLADFGFRCTLTMWLKIVVENYCHQLFARKKYIPEDFIVRDDRKNWENDNIDIDFSSLNMGDVMKILDMMPNECYKKLLIHRYLEERTNKETARLLNLSMANFYNTHLRAKAQFCSVLQKEGLL